MQPLFQGITLRYFRPYGNVPLLILRRNIYSFKVNRQELIRAVPEPERVGCFLSGRGRSSDSTPQCYAGRIHGQIRLLTMPLVSVMAVMEDSKENPWDGGAREHGEPRSTFADAGSNPIRSTNVSLERPLPCRDTGNAPQAQSSSRPAMPTDEVPQSGSPVLQLYGGFHSPPQVSMTANRKILR